MSAQITSDGKTVWLNINGQCQGRLCKISAEYVDENWQPLGLDVPPNWEGFVRKCSELFGVDSARFEGHRPQWDRKDGTDTEDAQ